jgi:hypothetical protein
VMGNLGWSVRFEDQGLVQVDNTRQITSNLNSLRGIKNTLTY